MLSLASPASWLDLRRCWVRIRNQHRCTTVCGPNFTERLSHQHFQLCSFADAESLNLTCGCMESHRARSKRAGRESCGEGTTAICASQQVGFTSSHYPQHEKKKLDPTWQAHTALRASSIGLLVLSDKRHKSSLMPRRYVYVGVAGSVLPGRHEERHLTGKSM